MCSTGWSGTVTPPSLPISRAQSPPQLTTTSQERSPALVRTPATAPLTTVIPVTLTFSQILTPPARAPLASAAVTSAGLAADAHRRSDRRGLDPRRRQG